MQRRLEALIPIVLLAVMVQLIAPIAAFRVAANAVSGQLYMTAICSGMGPSQDDLQTAPGRTEHRSGSCCAFCAAGHGGAVALNPPALVFVILQRQYQLVSWLEPAEPMSTLRVGSNAQARAPPTIS